MHNDSQDFAAFSTKRTRGKYRVCQCGKTFVAVRGFVRWCSNQCRKQFYKDRRALFNGDWRVRRKHKHDTLGRHTIWQFRQKLKAIGSRCYWCGISLGKFEVTEDHLTPISRGGTDDISNIVPACQKCNFEKHTKTEKEYLEFLVENGRFPQIDSLPVASGF